MNHGILLRAGSIIQSWTWADPTCPNPIECEIQPGDQLCDVSGMSEPDQLVFIDLVRHAKGPARDRLLAALPKITLPVIPDAPAGHRIVLQPGYRRICYRPTDAWHQEETAARFVTNHRIQDGELAKKAIDEEFTHLTPEEKHLRADMLNDGQFPLVPMVRLIDHKKLLPDGTTANEIFRQFPYHEPVATI